MPAIKVTTFDACECGSHEDAEAQGAYYEALARKDPRIQLHVVSFPGQPRRVFPMKSSDARVHDGLLRMAREINIPDGTPTIIEEGHLHARKLWGQLVEMEQLPVVTFHEYGWRI